MFAVSEIFIFIENKDVDATKKRKISSSQQLFQNLSYCKNISFNGARFFTGIFLLEFYPVLVHLLDLLLLIPLKKRFQIKMTLLAKEMKEVLQLLKLEIMLPQVVL